MLRRSTLVPFIAAFSLYACSKSEPGPDPAETIRTIRTAAAEGRPDVIWNILPESYQSDVEELRTGFTDAIDPEVWDAAISVGRKVVRVLQEKKEFILGNPMLSQMSPVPPEEIAPAYDEIVSAIDRFLSSEIQTSAGFKKVALERFLASAGADLMKGLSRASLGPGSDTQMQKMLAARIETVKREGTSAVVAVSDDEGTNESLAMSLVEGKWVPDDIADQWAMNVAEARQTLTDVRAKMASKDELLESFAQVEDSLDALLSAQNQQAFMMACMSAFAPLMQSQPR